ncbi:SAM-dependent methyltransferase [Marinilabilia rubra]|uniref:SAM-dependent methyltransferase n=1 Tax=Marinilabilia rubra TaxID=2162893 RepID=A0A2U2BAG0_9BACT|nr:SAM-dependent methyltransferase [Marinilabilia rubra]PWE00056.1 SAM-dependent methyltransferase [Marinilabilia rubra]
MKGKLYMIPNHLGNENTALTIPSEVAAMACQFRYFIVENLRTARRYLRLLDSNMDIDASSFFVLDKHTGPKEYASFLNPILDGQDIGVISEAGCPGVADPGAEIVKIAHQKNIEVVPLVGPSSILLALMGSGMNGQNFAFNGYLPIDKTERTKAIKHLEARSTKEKQTQLFIEAPYRNNALAQDILKHCRPDTLLCIACNVTLSEELIVTKPVSAWKGKLPDLHKKPTMFLIQA